jgi:hypothetical protein
VPGEARQPAGDRVIRKRLAGRRIDSPWFLA